MDAAPTESRLNLAELIEGVRVLNSLDDVAQAVCAHAVANLGLASASMSLVSEDPDDPRLDTVAAIGQLSPFVPEMSAPMEELGDAGKSALAGDPVFVGNPHGVKDENAQSSGIGRWRNGLGVHAYAVLGLTALGRTIGVLTLEWPEPQSFDDADRRELQLLAAVTALLLRSALPSADAAAPVSASGAKDDRAELAAYSVNTEGVIAPAPDSESPDGGTARRVWTAAASPESPVDSAAFAEVMSAPDGSVVLAVGTVTAGALGGSPEAATSARGVMRAAAARGSSPGEILALLGGAMRSHAGAAWTSATVASVSPKTGAASVAQAGSACTLLLRREGRMELAPSQAPPVGAGRTGASTSMHVVLSGDRVAVLSGRVAVLSDPACLAETKAILAGGHEIGGTTMAQRVLDLIAGSADAGAVAVIEMVEPVVGPAAQPAQ
jgi:hypothetical protein